MLQQFFLVFFLTCAVPALSLADDLSSIVQRHYSGVQTFSADFSQTLNHRESGAVEKRQGKILFSRPQKLRWETTSPRKELLIVGKDSIWNFIPDEEIAYQYSPRILQGATSIIHVITGQSDLMRDFDVKRMGLENSLQKLKLYPKKPSTQLVEADIWVDAASGVIHKAQSMDFYGNSNCIEFNNYRENSQIKESSFSFTPPKGTEIEDRRNDTAEKDLFQ